MVPALRPRSPPRRDLRTSAAQTSLPNTVHRPQQFAGDGSKIIYFSSSDRDPGVYYLYDRARQKLSELAVPRPGIEPEKMATVKRVTFAARDGLKIHAYLALPPGRPAKNLPLILHPHGGPFGIRDEWVFNNEVQYYASRGFAVLQVDYRGSGGYGRAFESAGYKKHGLEMQDDLSDGVKWAIAEGLADPARVVISGASYGGYAAMAGLTFTPDLYCAGINSLGPTDYEIRIPKGGTPSQMPGSDLERILSQIPGNPWKECTMEAAPGSITRERIESWRQAGVNRVSLGVQSFIPSELARTGRKHTAAVVEAGEQA